jgi:long-subunit fatty acid transport protein
MRPAGEEDVGGNIITRQQSNDGTVTWSTGAQFDVSPRLRIGGSYRSGAEFETNRELATQDDTFAAARTFTTPSSYAAGVAFDVTPRLTFAADAVRVRYSEMTEALVTSTVLNPAGWIVYEMPDVTELRAGAEYRLPARIPVALRAGWWHDPAHRLRATGRGTMVAAMMNLTLLDQDETHVTAGIGVGDRVRFDAALDRSENTTRASIALSSTF